MRAVLAHVRRVAWAAPAEARTVAWLHEALELTAVSEQELLLAGLSIEELRALRLLCRRHTSRSDTAYFGHLELIARAAGRSGTLARVVKILDLEDRSRHPHVRPDGWAPPYQRALERMRRVDEDHDGPDRLTAAARAPLPPY